MKKFFSDFYNWYLVIIGSLATLPILAPIFLALNWTFPAKLIYFIYSFFCHQFASRSLNILDYQYAWCARDTAIWLGVFITALLVKYNKLPKIRWYWVLPFVIPMALDGGLQTIFTMLSVQPVGDIGGMPLYISNNLSRFMTGAIFGIGVGWWISWQLKMQVGISEVKELKSEEVKEINSYTKGGTTQSKIKNYTTPAMKALGVVCVMLLIYISLVFIWNISSNKNKPADFVDSIARTPSEDFFSRRENGVCPTTDINNLLNLECFLR